MTTSTYQPSLHRYAVVTIFVALLAMGIGALVTTMNAGMAFLDWPNSDGYNLFFYPWLASAGDKFIEHGHRLAGSLIGFVSIGLVIILWRKEERSKVRWAGWLVLGSVIFQGLLGGLRVLENDPRMAMAHGLFAAFILSMMAAVALFTSRHWLEINQQNRLPSVSHLFPVAILTVLVVLAQYLLGGMLRHLGMQLFEHVGFAALVFCCCITFSIMLLKSGIDWLKKSGWMLLTIMGVQILLGLSAFVTKYGFPPTGYVAVQHSVLQVVIRTSHTLVGMLLLATSITTLIRIIYINSFHIPDKISVHLTLPQIQQTAGGTQ